MGRGRRAHRVSGSPERRLTPLHIGPVSFVDGSDSFHDPPRVLTQTWCTRSTSHRLHPRLPSSPLCKDIQPPVGGGYKGPILPPRHPVRRSLVRGISGITNLRDLQWGTEVSTSPGRLTRRETSTTSSSDGPRTRTLFHHSRLSSG